MRHVLAVLLLGTLAACTPPKPPIPPQPGLFDLSVVVTSNDIRLPGATVTIDGHAFLVNENGWMATQVAPGEHAVQVRKDGYVPVDARWTIVRHTRKVVGLNPLTAE